MVKKIVLNAKMREEKNKANLLRKTGFIPAVVYGSEIKNMNIKIKGNELANAYEKAGESTLIDLDIEGKDKIPTIIKEVQIDPIKNKVIHADFYKVNMKEKLEVEIPLEFTGESKAVKELGGTLVRNIEFIQARCLPNDLVDHIEVNISSLNDFDDAIHVKDLKISDKIEILNQMDGVVANISAPSEEEEEVPAAPEAGVAPAETAEEKTEEKKE